MSGLTIAQGIVLYLILAWKLTHLARAPHDLPLRSVTACIACAAAAYPFGIAFTQHPGAGAARWLMLIQCSLLLGMAYCLDCFFLFSLFAPVEARQRAVRRAFALATGITAMAVAAAMIPPGTSLTSEQVAAVAVMYLAFDLSIGCFLADALRWTLRGIHGADPVLGRALAAASTGLALMIAGLIPLAGIVVLRWARLPSTSVLVTIGLTVVVPGILVFLAGICYPGTVMRLSAVRVWNRHRRASRQLAPLWEELHQAFPEDALARVPASRWRDSLSPWAVHRRYYRRIIECRDGLVRLSPRLGETSEAPLAERLLVALQAVPAQRPATAVPVAIPSATGLDEDAAELITLAREVARTRSRKDTG